MVADSPDASSLRIGLLYRAAMANRYVLSREDVGILLSFARHPEVITENWVRRLGNGVDEDELRRLFDLAGLPWTIVRSLCGAEDSDRRPGLDPYAANPAFRRAILGTIVVFTLAGVGSVISASGITVDAVATSTAFALAGILLLQIITRLPERLHSRHRP